MNTTPKVELEQGKIVKYVNGNKQQIIWMVLDDNISGVVLHSDDLLKLGTVTELSGYELSSFVGKVTINSTKNE